MAYEMKDFTGSLFKNEDKLSDTHADYTGSIMVAGVEYWLNSWLKVSKNGKKFLSLSVKPKVQRNEATAKVDKAHEAKGGGGFVDDEQIPF